MNTALGGPPVALLGAAAREDAERRVRGCSRPIRLVGSSTRLNAATGEVLSVYGSAQELDGFTWVRCGDRRAARCESCSREYKGDAWHLLSAGLVGGKGAPDSVTEHPTVFVTLTAPSFGPVHGRRRGAPCRVRRDRPVCPHGRPLYCLHRHREDDRRLGEPLCAECYDYVGHVLWQWHAPELWRRFTIGLGRHLARMAGVSRRRFARQLARVSYTKVAEFQARGLIHVHAVMRLDGPTGPDSPPRIRLDALALGEAIATAARAVRLEVHPTGHRPVILVWGEQIDTRPITLGAGRDDQAGDVHPEMVAAYLAKYLTKSTEDFGLDGYGRVHSATDARYVGGSPHAVRIIETAEQLAATGGDYERLADRYGTLGYRGHVMTKTRRYSTTFGALRQARAEWRQRGGRPAPEPGEGQAPVVAGHHDDPDGVDAEIVIERNWRFAGVGFLDLDTAALALTSAALAREHR